MVQYAWLESGPKLVDPATSERRGPACWANGLRALGRAAAPRPCPALSRAHKAQHTDSAPSRAGRGSGRYRGRGIVAHRHPATTPAAANAGRAGASDPRAAPQPAQA
jgi:hypothetical protein